MAHVKGGSEKTMKRFSMISNAAMARGEIWVKTGFLHRLIGVTVCLFALAAAGVGQITESWVARYNGPAGLHDAASKVALDAAENVYVTGASYGAGTGADYATIKYDSNGNQLWLARYNGPGNLNDGGRALAVDAAGNIYVTGYSDGAGTGTDYATIKYDSNGNQLWVARYNGPGNSDDRANALAVDAAGNVYVTGSSWGVGSVDYATIKYDSTGNQLWVSRYNGPANLDYADALAVDAYGYVYVTGTSFGAGTARDYATIKYNSSGNQLWVARYNGPENSDDWAVGLAMDAARNVYVTGQSWGLGSSLDYATIKYDSSGNQLWVARYNGPGNGVDAAHALAVDGAGNVYVTGESWGAETVFDYATIKYDSAGNQRWVARYNGPGGDYDQAYALAVDAAGNVYVTGESYGGDETSYDYATIKYSQRVTIPPLSFTLFRGLLISGNLQSLIQSDNNRLVIRPGVVFSSHEPPIQLIVDATSPNATPSRLEFSVEAHCSVQNIEQRIALYNFDTQAYETLNTSTATTSDSTVVAVVTSNPGRFVGINLQLRSRVAYKAQGPVFVYPWFARVDQVKWTLTD